MGALEFLFAVALFVRYLFKYFEQLLEHAAHRSPESDGDYRLPLDRERTRGKDLTRYDQIAMEQLRRLHERRRVIVQDNGLRRRKSDGSRP